MSPTTLLLLVSGCLMLQPLSTDLYLPSLPHLAAGFATTPAEIQQTLSLFVVGFGSAQLIGGPLSDRYGRRPVMLAGLAFYVLASFACASAPTLGWLIAARFLQAVGCCTAVVVARAIVRDAHSPAEGARVIARASSLLAFAPLLGPIAGGYLQVAFGWRAAFVTLATLGTLLALAALWRLRETNAALNPEATRPGSLLRIYARIAASPGFWAYAGPGALSYGAIFLFISGSSFVLISLLGVPTQTYGYLFALGVIGYLCGTLVCRRLLGRIGMARTLALGTRIGLLGAIVFFALVMAGIANPALVVAAQFFTMLAHGINFPCAQAGSVAPFPAEAGAAAGLFGAATMFAALLAGLWIGASHDGTLMPLAAGTVCITGLYFAFARALVHRA